jgi:hypothetical protein
MYTGVWIGLSKHSPNWRVVKKIFTRQVKKNNWPNLLKLLVRGKKNPRQAGEWVFIFTYFCIFTRQA